jgi:uncharacterized protein (UPF0264 family)
MSPSLPPSSIVAATVPIARARRVTDCQTGQPQGSPGLLVSVRSIDELETILNLRVDVIDFKEPSLGPLAAVNPSLWQHAAERFGVDQKLSAALGEWDQAISFAGEVPPSFAYAKAGPAGVKSIAALVQSWHSLSERLPGSVELVAVAYADADAANCPVPEAIFAAAQAAGIKTWLLDTFTKGDAQGVTRQLSPDRLRSLRCLADRAGATWVLAGSIKVGDAIELASQSILPDLFGVRGDVCDHSRCGVVVAQKVARWLGIVRSLADCHHHHDDRNGSHH